MTPKQIEFIEMLRAWAFHHIGDDKGPDKLIWSDAWTFLKYILTLPISELKLIALHCAYYGGDSPATYMGIGQALADKSRAHIAHDLFNKYDLLTADLPPMWHLSEFPIPGSPYQKGIEHKGKVVSPDLLRYQQAISNLYLVKALDRIVGISPRPTICEIGAGYGLLAGNLINAIGNCRYVIVDLPQTIFTAGAYLALNCPEKSIYLVNEGDTPETLAESLQAHDFVLCPAAFYEKLSRIAFGLVINVLSFQEMPQAVIEHYARFFSERTEYIYSDNWGAHPWNKELHRDVEAILGDYYRLFPDPKLYDHAQLRKAFHAGVKSRTRPFVGVPHGNATPLSCDYLWADCGLLKLAFV